MLGAVCFVLFVGAVTTFARKVQASRVTRTALVASVGTAALEAAGSAIEEALVLVGERANQPGDELFEHLRDETLPGTRETLIETPVTRASLAGDELTAGMRLEEDGVRVSLLGRSQVGMTPYEHTGRVRFTARVTHPGSGISRQLLREYTLRVSLLSTPRPFDQFSWCILDPEPLLDPLANDRIRETVDLMVWIRSEVAPRVRRQITDLLTRINQQNDAAIRDLGVDLPRYDVRRYVAPFDQAQFLQPPEYFEDVRTAYHYFPQDLVLLGQDTVVPDLSILNLRPRADARYRDVVRDRGGFESARDTYEDAHRRLFELGSRAVRTQQDLSRLDGAFQDWLQSVEALGRSIRDLNRSQQEQIRTYQKFTGFAGELAGADREYLLSFQDKLSIDYVRSRAHHRFSGPGAVAAFEEFLSRSIAPGSSGGADTNAIVHVDNGTDPLSLDFLRSASGRVNVRGKLVVAATGPVILRDVFLDDPTSDLFVVFAGGDLTVQGTVQGSLIARAGIRSDPDATVEGNLVLASVARPDQLAGRLENRERRYYSGVQGAFRPTYTYAALGPWPVVQTADRSR